MLRLNIGAPPKIAEEYPSGNTPGAGANLYLAAAGTDLKPVVGDPFGQAGGSPGGMVQIQKPWETPPPPADGPGDPSTIFSVQPKTWGSAGGAPSPPPAPAPPAGTKPYAGDPFTDALTGRGMVAGGSTGQIPSEFGGAWPDTGYTGIPQPGTKVDQGQQTIINRGNPGFWDVMFGQGYGEFDPVTYTGPTPDVGQGPGLTFNSPIPDPNSSLDLQKGMGPSYTPPNQGQDLSGETADYLRAKTEELKRIVNATPVGTGREPFKGDGTSIGNQGPGTVSYDPSSGDQFGGHASAKALAAASLIPLTDAEALKKRIAIYSADIGIPPDRFFTDNDGILKYVDLRGQVFSVAPTMGGGSIKAPFDLARRTVAAGLSEAGQIGVNVFGAVGGYYGGYGPGSKLLAGMAGAGAGAAGAEIARQILGNAAAAQAGYKRPPELGPARLGADVLDIDGWNVAGQALQNMGFEAFARMVPLILNGFVPAGLLGNNPYRLNRQELSDLAYLLAHDMETGGHILKRAQAAHELGMPLTPRDLLQSVDGLGMGAGYAEAQGRLIHSFEQLEATLANRAGKRGAGAREWMQNFYRARQHEHFPNAVQTMGEKIYSGADYSVKEGFTRFQKAGNKIIERLEDARLEAGHNAGWGQAFGQGQRVMDTRNVRQFVRDELRDATGVTKTELKTVLDELEPGGASEFSLKKLHNLRMDVRSRINELSGTGKTSAEANAVKQLRRVEELLNGQLRQSPLYRAGDDAFTAASAGVDEAKQGFLSLLTENPLYQEQLGGALAEAGPTKIAAVKKLFADHGMSDVFNAHTRAYLDHSLMLAGRRGGDEIGANLWDQIANTPTLRAGLREMAPDARTGELLDQLLSMGHAMDARAAGMRRTQIGTAVSNERLSPRGSRDVDIFSASVSPLKSALRLSLGGKAIRDAWRETGTLYTAKNMTGSPASTYSNMQQMAVPLAGRAGEMTERALYLAADPLNEATQAIPRVSPEWLAKLALPYIHSPPALDPTAPDLAPMQRPPFKPTLAGAGKVLGLAGGLGLGYGTMIGKIPVTPLTDISPIPVQRR